MYQPEDYSGLYFPLAGDGGLKSCITPTLGGDSKRIRTISPMEPVSIENLHNNKKYKKFLVPYQKPGILVSLRFVGRGRISAVYRRTGEKRTGSRIYVAETDADIRSPWTKSRDYFFVTVDGAMEVMMTELTNITEEPLEMTPIAVMPVYGRSADNIVDHRHVTSLLHRICTTDYGVEVTPAMSFDERGHQKNHTTYFVYGSTGEGEAPAAFYPTVGGVYRGGGSISYRRSSPDRKAGSCGRK